MSTPGNSVLRWNASDGIINYCNGSFSRKCNAAPHEIIGKHINQLNTDNGVEISHLNDLTLVPGEPQADTLLWVSNDGCKHTELTTIQALSNDGQTVTDIQINGLEEEQELNFRVAQDALLEVVADTNATNDDKLQRMLDIGLGYFSMQSGVIGSTMGHTLELICVSGVLTQTRQRGDYIPFYGSIDAEVLKSDKVVAISNTPLSEISGVCRRINADLRSYIGTQILTSNGPLGIISFCSDQVRTHPFNSQDIKLISQIANCIGIIIGNEEQLEFLSLQHDYYLSLFQSVPAMMMLCNVDGLILSTSDRLSEKLGIDPLSIPGKSCHQFFVQSDKHAINQALTSGNVDHLPLTLCSKNVELLDIELNCRIKNLGSMRGVRMIVLADVSEHNKAINSVNEQNKQLALINQSLNQFAFIASHDLQEPLRKIQQFCCFLQDDLNESIDDNSRYHLDVIVNSAKGMSTLVQDLLDFSSAAKDDLDLCSVNLNDLMIDVCSELELCITESKAQISIGELPTIQGDSSLVKQLLTNLVSNSIKYRDPCRSLEIEIVSVIGDEKTTIAIKDNGIGFDNKLKNRALEPFRRLHNDKKYKGNGIGLAICATVCEKHDWKLSVNSQPGSGSVFAIEISSAKTG